jgi:hypothetical protein
VVDEPRRGPGRPRKDEPTYKVVTTDPNCQLPVSPGPLRLDLNIEGRNMLSQRVYAYTIDHQPDQTVITCALRPTPEPE